MRRILFSFGVLLALATCGNWSPTAPFGNSNRASLFGKVTDGNNGFPIAGARVAMTQSGQVAGNAQSDGYGRYSIRGLSPGHYNLIVFIGSTPTEALRTEIDVHDGENPYDIVIRF